MKIITLCLLLLVLSAPIAISSDFYDMDIINTVEITFTESNWDQILDQFYADGDEERLVGTVIINGASFDSVGVRYKGNSSYSPTRTKNPFNIKLDHIIDDQTLDGYGTLKLANVYKDPSFVRETLGYEIARKYTPASKANYINVYVNNELIGLYTSVQSVDKLFLEHHFYNEDNTHIKGDPVGHGGGGATLQWLGSDSTAYYDNYEMKSDYGWGDLVNLCNTLNNYTSDIENILNIDRVMWHLAYHNALVSLDSPINTPHNFYLYCDEVNNFNYIFWDLNMTFGTFSHIGGPGGPPMSVPQLQELSPLVNVSNTGLPILNKLLPIDQYQKIYIAHMRTIIEENFANGWYETRGQELQDLVAADVLADPNKFYSYQYFLENLLNSVGSGSQTTVGIVELMSARVDYLLNHSLFQGPLPLIENINTPEFTEYNTDIWVSAEISDADLVQFCYRSSVSERFIKLPMFDDGNHNDGAADDGRYGVSVHVDQTDLHYYIYAENNQAVSFSPARAEYEFYTLPVTGMVVINEFLADNVATMPDPAGEYDDWIELYNNTTEPVSLSGYYLSDNSAEPLKWSFPDVSIDGSGYLIIWADDDEEQEGIHTNFKLSASGEVILLVDPSQNVISEITFPQQTEDISMGRLPNGTGAFVEMTPTFGANNSGVSGVDEPAGNPIPQLSRLHNYPNPFRPDTAIRFALVSADAVKLEVFDVTGRHIQTLISGDLPAGQHEYKWQSDNNESGLYFYKLTTGSQQETRRMLLLK